MSTYCFVLGWSSHGTRACPVDHTVPSIIVLYFSMIVNDRHKMGKPDIAL
jgi:hypothetical protein